MGAFEYQALDHRGRQCKGVLEGDTPRQVRQQLREKGWAPLAVVEVQEKEAGKSQGLGGRVGTRISPADQALLTRQLATLIEAGTPLAEALQAVAAQTEKRRLKNMLLAIRAKVKEGHALAVALADFPNGFDDLYRATVGAGEQSGRLGQVLSRLADYTETRHGLRQKFQLALIYPLSVAVVALLVVVGLLIYVVPKIIVVFENAGQTLPLLTQWLILISEFAQLYWLWGLGSLLLMVVVYYQLMRQTGPRRLVHRLLLTLPIFSRFIRGVNSARFARTFSILVGSGVPALQGMQISAEVVTNLPMRESVEAAALRVREGAGISQALGHQGYFPPMTVHLIASGEASGQLDAMLERAAIAQEREVETLMAVLLGIFEPMMILTMGGAVLLIVLAVLLPIFELNQIVH